MDWFAILSLGAYPDPTPTNKARSFLAASLGLLSNAGAPVVTVFRRVKWLTTFTALRKRR